MSPSHILDVECDVESLEPRKPSSRFLVHRAKKALRKSPLRSPPRASPDRHNSTKVHPVYHIIAKNMCVAFL